MKLLRQLAAGIRLSLHRVRSSIAVHLALIATMAALVGIWVGIPLYAESATSRLLSEQVDDAETDSVPFGYLFSFNRLSGGTQPWSAIAPVSEYLEGPDTPFGSTVQSHRRFVETVPFEVYLAGDLQAANAEDLLVDRFSVTSTNDVDNDVILRSGRAPGPPVDGNPLEVMLHVANAEALGLTDGDSLTLVNQRKPTESLDRELPLQVVGLWDTDADQMTPEARFARSGIMRNSLVVSDSAMASVIANLDDEVVSGAQWLVVLDSGSVTTDNVDELLNRTNGITRAVDDRLSGTRLLVSPESSLEGFSEQVERLNSGLSAFSVPTLALVLAVVGLLVSMMWRSRRFEIDLLRSRGVPARTIIGTTFVESIVIAAAASGIGVIASFAVATFMARTTTFLQLGRGVDLDLVFNSRAQAALVVAALVLIALQVIPSAQVALWSRRASQRTSDTRSGAPWWQRRFLDLAAIGGVGFFAWFVLRGDVLRGELLDDPVVILLPAALSVAAGLIVLRMLPLVMSLLARGLERTSSTALLLVARRAGRVPAALTAPLMLLVITGALSIYTASLARTLDLQLLDEAYHDVGSVNAVIDEAGANGTTFDIIDGVPSVVRGAGGPPISADAYDRVWGLETATRLAQLPGRARTVDGSQIPIEFTGIDASSFGDAAFWRDDYASESLPELLSRIQATPDGVLVYGRAMAANELRIGDTIDVSVTVGDRSVAVPMVIVGSFRQFPTWRPSSDLVPVVGSLGDFEARLGTSVPRRVLFSRTSEAIDDGQTRADFARLGISNARVESAAERIMTRQVRPERQGVFGLLTVSFALSSLLTLVGFVFYAAFGFTQQVTELGVLRALGLELRGLLALVGLDLLLVAFTGTAAAVITGVGMATFVLPELIGSPANSAPRLLQEIDWAATVGIAGAILVALVAVTGLLLATLRRIRLFEAIKLGAE